MDRVQWTSPERFVKLVVVGGIAMVCGLWVASLRPTASPGWLVGVALVAVGVAGLAAGIHAELDY